MAIHKRKLDFSDNVLTKKTERSAANSPNEINQYIFSRGIDYFLSESCSKLKKEIMIKPITQSFQKLRTPRKDEINIQNNKTSSKYGKKLKTYHKFSYDASTECRKNPTHNDQKQYNSAIDSKKRIGKVFEEYINATRPHNKSLLDCTNETSDAIKVCNSNLINHPRIDNYSYFSRKNQNTQNPVFSVFNKILSVPNSKSEPTPKNCILKEYFLEPLNFNHKHSKEVRENFKLPPLSEQLDGKCQSEPTKNTSKKFSIFEKFPETFADVSEIDSRKIKKIASKSSKRNKKMLAKNQGIKNTPKENFFNYSNISRRKNQLLFSRGSVKTSRQDISSSSNKSSSNTKVKKNLKVLSYQRKISHEKDDDFHSIFNNSSHRYKNFDLSIIQTENMLSNCEKMNTGLESLNIKKRPEKIQSSENNKNFKCKDISKSLFAKSEFRKMNKTFEGIIGKKEIRNEFQICRSFQECRKDNMQVDESKRLVSTSIQSLSFFEMHNKSSFLEPNQYMESDSKLNLSDESEYLEFSSRGIKPIRNTWQHFIQNLNDVDKDEQFFKLWEDSIEAPLLGTENIQQLEIDSQQNYLHTEDSDFSSRGIKPRNITAAFDNENCIPKSRNIELSMRSFEFPKHILNKIGRSKSTSTIMKQRSKVFHSNVYIDLAKNRQTSQFGGKLKKMKQTYSENLFPQIKNIQQEQLYENNGWFIVKPETDKLQISTLDPSHIARKKYSKFNLYSEIAQKVDKQDMIVTEKDKSSNIIANNSEIHNMRNAVANIETICFHKHNTDRIQKVEGKPFSKENNHNICSKTNTVFSEEMLIIPSNNCQSPMLTTQRDDTFLIEFGKSNISIQMKDNHSSKSFVDISSKNAKIFDESLNAKKIFLSTFSDNYRRQNIQTATDIIQPQETNITHSRKGQKLLVQENLDKNGTTQNLIIEVNKGIDEFENLQEIEQYTEFQFLGDEKDQNGCDTMQFLSKNIVLRADDLLQHTSPEEVKKYSTRAIEKMSCSPMHSSTSSGLDKIDNDQLHEPFQGAIVLSDTNQITKEFVEGSEKTKCFLKNTNTKTCFMQNLNFKESSKYDSNIFKESQDREIERVVSGQEEEIINNNSVTHTTPLKQFNEVLFQQRNHLESGNNPNILDSCSQENQFSKAHYELLKAVSSPLLVDLECNTYLKSLVDNEKKKKVSSDLFNNQSPIRNKQFNENFECYFMLPNEENIIHKSTKNTKNTKTSQVNFQEKECTQLWKTMLSQNQNSQSQISDSFNSKSINSLDESGISSQLLSTQNSNKDKIEISQGSCSEIFDYLSSQDFEDTNSIMTTALKNITNLSQTSMSRRSLSFICDQNSLKLLELAFQIYAQFKEKNVSTNTQESQVLEYSKNIFEMKKEGKFKVYSLISACTEKFNDKSISSASTSTYLDDINFPNTGKREADEKILKGLNEVCMDKSLLYIEEEDNIPHHGRGPKYTMWRICAIFEDVLQKFAMKKSPELSIRKQTFEECSFYKGRLVLKPCENPRMIRINFRNALSQPKFCLILYILAKVLDLLDNKSKSTKREIYYQIKNLISNQGKVDNALKAVSCMLGLGPWDLNIISHKGLVFGNLKITMSTNEVINCNIPGTLIPQEVDDIVELEASAYFILVVEKESIFFKLLDENLPHRLTKPFIMITGKGFPDLNTQLFLRKLWIVMSIPVFILTDADPHGVNIMIAYRFGSLANAHISDQLAVPKAKWLGVFPSEILKLNAEKQSLTENERRVVKNILKTPYIKGNPRIEQELKILLEFNYKTGIEGIMKNNNFLSEFYFPMKFHSRDLI